MIEFEDYKENVDIIDKFGILNHIIDKSEVYNGDINLLRKKKEKPTENKDTPLAAAVVGVNNTALPLPADSKYCNIWTDIDAQEQYVDTNPTCYLILSKGAGTDAYNLGEAMAKKYNCVHLCPRNIIIDEMEQGSLTGKCMDYNMRHNRVLKYDTILTLLKMKVNSLVIKNRGYVISGIPLVTNSRCRRYLITSLSSEESIDIMEGIMYDLICSIKKKKTKSPKAETGSSHSSDVEQQEEEEEEEEPEEQLEEGEEEEEPQLKELPKHILETCSNVIYYTKAYYDTKQSVLLKQLDYLFNLSIKPNIILYISCPDIDLVTKRSHKYINYKNSSDFIEPFEKEAVDELRWPTKYILSDSKYYHHDQHSFTPKYKCRQPNNFPEKIIDQLCNYKKNILQFIEKKIREFDPKNVIKLDTRTTKNEMIHLITETFINLPIKPVLIPEPLYLEDPPEDLEEFWKLIEESNVIQAGGVTFNRYASPWFNRCPVELKNRQSTIGKPKFAVSYFKHVYLLSSPSAVISFCRNPKPYLKLKYLEPTCRIITMGTKSSGKTMVCKCLSWLFDVPIICFKTFVQNEKKKKYKRTSQNILSEIIATIEDARLEKWHTKENERITQVNLWYSNVLNKLVKYIPLLIEVLNYEEKQKIREQLKELKHDSDGSMHVDESESESPNLSSTTSEESIIEISETNLNKYIELKDMLSFLPFLDSVEMCKNATRDIHFCMQYAPPELTTVTKTPPTPTLGDEDVTEAVNMYILVNELQKDLEPTIEELMLELIKTLSDIDTTTQEATNFDHIYGKYIIDDFPSDPEYWGYLSDSKLLPDYTIAIIENRELDADILQHYTNIEKSLKNYAEKIMLVNDPLMNIKRRTKKMSVTSASEIQMIVHDLVNNASNLLPPDTNNKIAEDESAPKSESPPFSESIDKFREDWDSIKIRLEEKSKVFIEVEIDNKSDVDILEEVLLKIRTGYCAVSEENEGEEAETDEDAVVDLRSYNPTQFLGETSMYCPISYLKHHILWEGNPEFSIKYKNAFYYFAKEECLEEFKKDITRYQFHNFPLKQLPSLKICVVGCIGSGTTTVSKFIAKEMGLLHIDFSEAVNDYLMPRHIKRVGRKYENTFTDTPIEEEGVVDFQMGEENENLLSEILGNETELRRMVYNYFERGAPLVPILMQKLIKRLWCEEPFFSTGFVLDGFPRMPNEVEDMVECYCIPDLVIQLDTDVDTTLKRIANPMFKVWKSQQNEAKAKVKSKLDLERQEWLHFITRSVVIQLICEEILDNMFFTEKEATNNLSAASVVIDANPSGDDNIDAALFKAYNTMVEENPAPIDQSEWEKSDEARERIEARIESVFEVDEENLEGMNEALSEQRIKITNIDCSKSLDKVLRVALSKLTNLRNRCESFFEQTFIISSDIAETLILQGFYLLSKYNRMDPVYLYENPNAISCPYKVSKNNNRIFTVLHRSYVYYIDGTDNLLKFRRNPLLYTKDANFDSYFEYPWRIGIIGPPKSGKSTLAAKIAKKYGLVCISKGMALRHVLENMRWTDLASQILKAARKGECVKSDVVIKAVQVAVVDHRVNTHGFVFDGFPETASEARDLVLIGLYPFIIFDINTKQEMVIANSQSECYYDILKYKPPYSSPFIEYRFEQWQKTNYSIRDWVKDDYQNLYVINGDISKWKCFQESQNTINYIASKVNQYLINVNSNIVSASVMCISNEIFQRKMSPYKTLCPLCLQKNILRHSAFPVDRKGIVQFKDKFFWICKEHIGEAMNHPLKYLLAETVKIPEIPAVIKTVDCSLTYENGICIVTYAENLPSQIVVRGSDKLAATYRGKLYLFCKVECLEKFLAKPHNYFDITVFKNAKGLPTTTLSKLPNLGYLEQSVGNIITDACCSVNALRPKYPGLSINLSALIYIGLFLKAHNSNSDKSKQDLYFKQLQIYEARCRLMIDVGVRMRSRDNPLVPYPKCCGDTLKRHESIGQAPSRISHSSFMEMFSSDI